MKRSLLLLPFLAMFLMACPEKHTTSTATPPAPDPNGYNKAPVVTTTPNGGAEVVAPESNTTNNSSSNTSTTTGGAATITPDTATHIVGKPNAHAEEGKPGEAIVRPDTTRLVVSFISKGSGIDQAAKTNLDKWLSKHPDVKYTTMQQGREGEWQYCFVMKGRNATEQVKLIGDIKTAVGNSDRVLMNENVVCNHVHELAFTEPQVVDENTVPASRPDTVSNTARLVVSFASKGAGIDQAAKADFEKWLGERNATWETTNWGREGEVNFCFFLKNMDSRQQEIFVRDVRTFMSGKETVFVEEYAPCDKKK